MKPAIQCRARPSRETLAAAVAHRDPRVMSPEARLAEVAELLARALVRAAVANVARPVASVAPPAVGAPAVPARNRLALSPEPEPACDQRARPARRDRGFRTRPPCEDDR